MRPAGAIGMLAGLVVLITSIVLGFAASSDQGAVLASRDPFRVEVAQTNATLSERMTRLPGVEFGSPTARGEPVIRVEPRVRYQTVQGFGAAMTDSSAWLIEHAISAPTRARLMSALFGPSGIRLNIVRIPVAASDFTHDGRPYSYDDVPTGWSDPELRHFSIAHDRPYILPALRQARARAPGVEFLASPWTAPAWMKANDSLANAGDRGRLRPSAYRPWSEYLARFVAAYARAGVPIDALSVQNEPSTATAYPGMNFSARAERRWIARDLRPALAAAHERAEVDGGDLGWGPHSAGYLHDLLTGLPAPGIDGIAWHCYFGAPGVMSDFHARYRRLRELVDECSPGGPTPTPTAEIVIASMRDWASSVELWNLALDPHGGPVQPPNHGCPHCVGLATIDPHTGAISFTRSLYELGQVSAFVNRGAQRIGSTHFVRYRYPHTYASVVTPGLDDVAFRNPDGSVVLVAHANSDAPIRFAVAWRGRAFSYTLPARATVTFVWNQPGPAFAPGGGTGSSSLPLHRRG